MSKTNQNARKLPPDHVIMTDLARGLSYVAMANAYEVNPEAVRSRVRLKGWTRPAANEPPAPPPNVIRESAEKVINSLGISVPRIVSIHGPFVGEAA